MSQQPRTDFFVETEAPPTRKPPIVETGVLGWLRANLFSSWWNTALTIVSIAFVIWAIIAFFNWSVQQANWSVITNNLHLFAIGTYPQNEAWRPLIVTVAIMALSGFSWRLWSRANWAVVVATVIMVAVLYLLPALAAPLPYPNTYIFLGGPNTDPISALSYVAQEGETVTFTLSPVEDLTAPSPRGFTDRTSLTVSGLARQQAEGLARNVSDAVEAGAALPEALPSGAILDYQEGEFVITARDVTASLLIYRIPYTSSTDEETGETVWEQGEQELLDSLEVGPALETTTLDFTFPETGWYAIVPDYEGETGAFWLEMDYVTLLDSSSSAVEVRTAEYGPAPDVEDKRDQVLDTSNFPFRGLSTLSNFLKLHLGPMAAGIADFALIVALATAAGYVVAQGLMLIGRDPDEETSTGQAWGRRIALVLWLLSPVVVGVLLRGIDNSAALPVVDLERWGGVLLTMALTVIGIGAAFPIGVLLALGRRSDLPVVRIFSTISIEFVRGVPLVTILFAASILVPLVDPSLSSVDNVVRAMIGMTFFSAAYLAEIIRGGLQAVPYGQTEAARALGMPGWQITLLIVLPQAMRAVIPAIMGQFVSLFKDTSLVLIIGLIDLLGIARSVINQADYIGLQRETLVFISVIYFVFSYLMSWASRRLELTGSGAIRRA